MYVAPRLKYKEERGRFLTSHKTISTNRFASSKALKSNKRN